MKAKYIMLTESDLEIIAMGLRMQMNNLSRDDKAIKNRLAIVLAKILHAQEKLA